MILEGNQRSGMRQMARHLMNKKDNEHIEIHEISGFLSDTVMGALQEIQATAKGTRRCKQAMFSVSLNPPQYEKAPVSYFENALFHIEQEFSLENQPRVVVFHEKNGRRHAHCVWSRIDAEKMTAINLSFYKKRLCTISKELYLQYGWNMPNGFINKEYRNPLNMSREEWQQAKRAEQDPRMLKYLFKRMWKVSDNRASFENVLKERGFWLAKGNRRGFVAVDYKGEIYSLSRWSGAKSKELKSRLGNSENLPTVEEVKHEIAHNITIKLQQHIEKAQARRKQKYAPLKKEIQRFKIIHQQERQTLKEAQEKRRIQEEKQRFERLPRGLISIWHRLTGKFHKIKKQNAQEVKLCTARDREEKQNLIDEQLSQRQKLQQRILNVREQNNRPIINLRHDITKYEEMKLHDDMTM